MHRWWAKKKKALQKCEVKIPAFTSLYKKPGKFTVGKTKDSLTAFSVHIKMMEHQGIACGIYK